HKFQLVMFDEVITKVNMVSSLLSSSRCYKTILNKANLVAGGLWKQGEKLPR
ncbi:hypothetical protein PanWU01x14_011880, partial [Parasponia andersonii]